MLNPRLELNVHSFKLSALYVYETFDFVLPAHLLICL